MNEGRQISRRIVDTSPGAVRMRSGDGTGSPMPMLQATSRSSRTPGPASRLPMRLVRAPAPHLPTA